MKKLFAFLRNRLDPRTQGLLSRQHITVWSIGALKPALYKCMASNYREKFVLEAARENAVFPCPLSSVPFRDPRSRPQHVSSPAVVGEATPEPGSQPWPSASAALAAAEAGAGAAAAAAAGSVPTRGASAPAVATSPSGGKYGNPAAGVGSKSTSPLSIKWPPKTPGQGPGPGPAVVGTPRSGIPLPASSPSSRLRVAAPSSRNSPGLQQVKKKIITAKGIIAKSKEVEETANPPHRFP